ncbi:uncharacterized protein K02A2.6-like [Lytechinus pictus]|uniref:uncharacterized protein K02A2.6-like n=1 Tax=Lytechinus pictus TaxID=7653 RepID=UPI0030BA0C18
MAHEIAPVSQFDPHGTAASTQWRKWIRGFELYVAGKGITDVGQKRALLLHSAGPAVQDIFFTLELQQGADEYEQTKKTLDNHFKRQVNVPYERYCFRQLKQDANETVDEFVVRLRQQAMLCEFHDSDEQIRDQVVEKCSSHKLRTKLLERGAGLSLRELRVIASTFEATQTQSQHMMDRSTSRASAEVRAVQAGGLGRARHAASDRPSSKTGKSCYRCGKTGHFAKDDNCPARKQQCNKCGKTGHFAICCKSVADTEAQDRRKNDGKTGHFKKKSKKSKGHIRNVEKKQCSCNHGTCNNTGRSRNEEDSDDVYAFYVNSINASKCAKVDVNIGGVVVKNMIIDSGTEVNIIDSGTWENMKKNNVECRSELTSQKLYAYGSEVPLKLKGKFVANVAVTGMEVHDTNFYVLDGTGHCLLSKQTAEKLGILKFQIPSQNVGMVELDNYGNLFEGIGKLKEYKLHLHIDTEVEPVTQNMYRIPYSLRDKVSEKLDELESLDIIERVESPSEWVSPVIVVPKPNGDIRLCVDMRQANCAIQRERHPIPTVDEVLYQMNGSTVFSKLDLKYGYHQIELDSQSREITTFVTHKGLYRYKRLMFGINAAPEKYQNVMSHVLSGCDGVANISDDIVVYGRTREEHDLRLHQVLSRLREKNLTLNKEKCTFGSERITFMGHTLSAKGVQPTHDRVDALRNAGKPKTSAEVRSFLGLVNFSARYIANLATIAEPLRRLVRKNEPFVWGPEQDESFTQLTMALTEGEALGYFRLDGDNTQLVTDASNVGLGAVLLQTYQNETRVISYASRSLTDAEKRYSTTEKEALGVVWACQKFHNYLYGVHFELLTDHKPLEVLYGPKSRPNARIERWVTKLMSYTFSVKYLPGRQNIADILSRQPVMSQGDESRISSLQRDADMYVRWLAEEATPNALSTREVEEASKDDEELKLVRESLENNEWGKEVVPFAAFRNEFSCIGYLLLRGTRIVIPKKLRKQCVALAHQGHLGVVGTKQRLRTKVWWPQMEKEVERYVKACHGCQITAAMPSPEPLCPTPLPTGPWQAVAIDLLGPLPSKDYIFVVVDYYSRYYEIDIMKDTSSDRIIESLEKMFLQHGLPISITSDNGPQFISQKFEEFLCKNGVEHRKVTPLHPAANGEVERQNRSIMKRVRIAQAEKKDWKREVRQYMFAYRTTPHSVTGVTPAEMMFQRKLRTRLPEMEEKVRLDEEVRDRDATGKQKNKVYIDQKRGAKEREFHVGEEVLLKQTKIDKTSTPFHTEPYKLIEKSGNSVVVESSEGVRYKRNSTHIQKYNRPDSEKDEHEDNSKTPTEMTQDKEVGNASVAISRPVREKRCPKRLDDFVLYR